MAWRKNFTAIFNFQGRESFSKNFDFNKRCKSKIYDKLFNNEKKHAIDLAIQIPKKKDFTVYSLHKDHPPAWDLARLASTSGHLILQI